LIIANVEVGNAHASHLLAQDRPHIFIDAESDKSHPQQISIESKRPIEIRHRDADVMDAAHAISVRLDMSIPLSCHANQSLLLGTPARWPFAADPT
jgi:hypothetical protein